MSHAADLVMNKVFFKPWVGKEYKNGGILGKRILVLGEARTYITSAACIKSLLNGVVDSWTPTFRKFERSLVNHITDLEASRKIWNSLAYCNYVCKEENAFTKSAELMIFSESDSLVDMLDDLHPDLIIVWGVSRLYDDLPGDERWRKGDKLRIDGHKVKNGYYYFTDGREARVLWIYHPATCYSWAWWYKIIKNELI